MTQKFIDKDGLKVLWNQISLKDYPNNETLMAVIDAIDETKANKDEIVQADWNQTDENKLDYIKNKPFYDTRELKLEIPFYDLPASEYKKGYAECTDTTSINLYKDFISNNHEKLFLAEINDKIFKVQAHFAVTDDGCGYLLYIDNDNGSDLLTNLWDDKEDNVPITCNYSQIGLPNGNFVLKILDGHIKQIDPKYIKDMYWSRPSETVLMEETQLTTVDGGVGLPTVIQLEEGKTYLVTYNDTEYECIAWYHNDFGVTFIGNGNIFDIPKGNGEPFITDGALMMNGEDASVTMKIVKLDEEINHIDPKYIKDMYYEDGDMTLLKEKVYVNCVNNYTYGDVACYEANIYAYWLGGWENLIDKTIRIIFDDNPYDILITRGHEMGSFKDGLPFALYETSDRVFFYTKESGEHTFEFYLNDIHIKQIDEKYIPDTIARKEYVDNAVANAGGSSVFTVNITETGWDEENNMPILSADKTFAEIYEAHESGKVVKCVTDFGIGNLVEKCDDSLTFLVCTIDGSGCFYDQYIIDNNNTISYGGINTSPEHMLNVHFESHLLTTDKTIVGAINELNAKHTKGTDALILLSPNGTRFSITVGDDGVLSAIEITE